jgi:pteridine reductase
MDTDCGQPVALITGAAVRIGAALARTLHEQAFNVVINYHRSKNDAVAAVAQMNQIRPNSALAIAGDVRDIAVCEQLAERALGWHGRLDLLVNNASTFYPTPIGSATSDQWEDLMGTNLKAPFFLSQACAPALKRTRGNIINIIDIYAMKSLANYPIYTAAKAGLVGLTRNLANDLAPDIRVNGIAPGSILWPTGDNDGATTAGSIARIPLGRMGEPDDIAHAVQYFIRPGNFVSGQILAIDGAASIV